MNNEEPAYRPIWVNGDLRYWSFRSVADDHSARRSYAYTVGIGTVHRPMNAFSMFCKIHRPTVRNHYPNLEHRAITKILVDWWVTLGVEEIRLFMELAEDYYTHAVFGASPNFGWHTPPAVVVPWRPAERNIDVSNVVNFESPEDGLEALIADLSRLTLDDEPPMLQLREWWR